MTPLTWTINRIKAQASGVVGSRIALLLMVLALALFAVLGPNGQRLAVHAAGLVAPSTEIVDYDADDDGLIEISNLEQLNAVRWDLEGNGQSDNDGYAAAFPSPAAGNGCPSGCDGYELAADLDFNAAGSYASGVVNTAWTSGAGWTPIGSWSAAFDGNGHTISNLHVGKAGRSNVGLFSVLSSSGSIQRLGLVNATVSGGLLTTGALVGDNQGGRITDTYGDVAVNGGKSVGGLVGFSTGTIRTSYVTGSVKGSSHNVGGLVGWLLSGSIADSYSTASVSVGGVNGGGLTGRNQGSSVRNSYSTGTVSGGGARINGLVGLVLNSGRTSNSYYDVQTSGRSGGIGGKTTGELKWPTSASGIYAQWNESLWNFGTAADYPLLVVDFNGDGTASWQEFGQQTRASTALVDYDTDDDGLIEIGKLEQLNAIRWDVDGNGISENSGHAAVFPNPAANNGCPSGCRGYELTADLDFNDAGSYASGTVNTGWTSGAGWTPIGSWSARWSAAFDGNGHTISNLFIKRSGNDRIGLFGVVGGSGY